MNKAGRPAGQKSHRNKGGLQAPDLTSRKARGGEGDGDLGEMRGLGRTGGRGTGLALFLFSLQGWFAVVQRRGADWVLERGLFDRDQRGWGGRDPLSRG